MASLTGRSLHLSRGLEGCGDYRSHAFMIARKFGASDHASSSHAQGGPSAKVMSPLGRLSFALDAVFFCKYGVSQTGCRRHAPLPDESHGTELITAPQPQAMSLPDFRVP